MSWTHISDTRPKARKQYRCWLCGETISRGETHVARRGIDSDCGYTTFRMHPECEQETQGWDEFDWECISEGDMERPGREATT